MCRITKTIPLICLVMVMLAAAARAQNAMPHFDEKFYQGAGGGPDSSIPLGTHINMQNWQNYRKFMPLGMQLLLEGKAPFKVPNDFEIVIGPTGSYPLPKKYREDTEKYSRQVQLVKLSTGGYTLKGYQAGLPFPDPSGPLAGTELLYNNYYDYQPYTSAINVKALYYDRFLSQTENSTTCVHFKTSHISDPGKPLVIPGFEDIYLTENCEVMAPEQSKYTTVLQVFYDDPARVAENYVFVPSLRRSLRLSAAARCAPFAGGDFTNDDFRNGFNLQVPIFQAKFLGTKRLLTMVFDNKNFYDSGEGIPKTWYWPSFIPRPIDGKWQLRDMYVFEDRKSTRLNSS